MTDAIGSGRIYNMLFLSTGNSARSDAFHSLRHRIPVFTALPLKSLDGVALGARLREIGQLADGTTRRADVA